jgi:uncharacterized SAM-binding protein YcdF (DUF218 family)
MFLLHLKTYLRELAIPPAGPLLLGLLGLWLLPWRPRLARVLLAVCLGTLWLLSMPVIADALTRAVVRYPALDWTRAAKAQAIVILGGGGQRAFAPEYGGPAADPVLLERLAYGAYVAQRTHLPVLVTGNGIEAIAMRDTLRRNFATDSRWVDAQAYDTFENAHNAMQLLRAAGIERVILITRGTHMRRSVNEFVAAGAQVVPAPVGLLGPPESDPFKWLPDADHLARSSAAIYELLGEPVRIVLAASHLRHQ